MKIIQKMAEKLKFNMSCEGVTIAFLGTVLPKAALRYIENATEI